MGSDRAPRPEIEGAIQAARQYGVRILLVGPEAALRGELRRYPMAAGLPIEIVHASEVITMEDKAVQAVRAKRDSSMRVGLRLVREGQAAGFVTAGNPGAAMASASKRLECRARPRSSGSSRTAAPGEFWEFRGVLPAHDRIEMSFSDELKLSLKDAQIACRDVAYPLVCPAHLLFGLVAGDRDRKSGVETPHSI